MLRRHFAILAILGSIFFAFLLTNSGFGGRETLLYYGAMPARLFHAFSALQNGEWVDDLLPAIGTLFYAEFLHVDAAHLIHNALFLWIFGAILEPLIGSLRVLVVFLIGGAIGNIAQAALTPGSLAPVIGASGAVAALEGAYLALALRHSLPWPHVWPIARPIPPTQLVILCGVNFYLDVFAVMTAHDHVAYGAHVGGFLGGALLGLTVLGAPRIAAAAPPTNSRIN